MRAEKIQKILMEDNGGFIAVNKNLIASLGIHEAILFTELVSKLNYYQENDMAVDEFYCTYDDLYISTGILKTAQQTALKNLENFGLIKINLKGMPRKRYIRILDAKEKIIEYLEEGQKKIDELINQSKEKSNILKEKIAESLNNKQLAEICQQESRNLLTSNQKSANKLAEICQQVSRNLLTSNQKSANKKAEICQQESRNLLTSSQESAINNNRIIILDNNNKEIINNNNNKINNNKEIIKENNNNLISDTKEEINSFFDTKEKNINNSSLVIQKDMIIDYYFEKYNDTYNKTHDKIDNEKIYSKIDNFSLSYNIDSGTWIELIDHHFSLSSIETNGSIDNFLSDNIIKKYLDSISINNDSLDTKEENNDNSSLIQKDMIIDYYFEEYKNAYNKLHDKINKEKIYSKIDNLSLSYNIDNQMWIELIDFHFNLSSLETDGSIYHFLSDNIIKIYLIEVNNFKNSSLVSTKENNLEYARIDDNIKEILQYFVDKYYSYFGINYWEKENFYVNDIVKYAKLIEFLSSDFGLEVTLDCWKKKIDMFFELNEYDKTLDTFLQFNVMNDIIAERMTNSEYYEEYEEYKKYDDVELPF